MKCNKCGNELNEGDLFCGNCGNKVTEAVTTENKKIEKNKKSKVKIKKIVIIIIAIIIMAFIVGSIYCIKNTNNSFFNNNTIDKSVDIEYSKMRDYIERLNNINTNEYQSYLADFQRINYIGYKPINPPEASSVEYVEISFVEKYENKYIYKFQTSKAIQYFSFPRQAHTPGQTYSYVKPTASVNDRYKINTDYYFAKNIDTNQYILFEKGKETSIFENDIFTSDINKLKKTSINTNDAQNNEIKIEKDNNTASTNNTLNYQEVSASNKSAIYQAYLATIRSYKEKNENYSVEYALTDINNDGTQELIIMSGTSNADYEYDFYTYDINRVRSLGYSKNGSAELYKMNNENYLKQIKSSMGYQTISKITYENDDFSVLELYTQEVKENDEYEVGDELIIFYDNSSLEALEILNK